MDSIIERSVPDCAARRVFSDEIVPPPIRRWSDWSRNKAAATVWANVEQNLFDTGGAKGAFVAADAGLKRIRRQGLVAVFTSRSEFKHRIVTFHLTSSYANPFRYSVSGIIGIIGWSGD